MMYLKSLLSLVRCQNPIKVQCECDLLKLSSMTNRPSKALEDETFSLLHLIKICLYSVNCIKYLCNERQARGQQQQEQDPEEVQIEEKVLYILYKSISCHSQMVKSVLFNLFLQIFCMTYIAYIFWEFSHRFVLLQLWIQDLVTIFILIYYNYRRGDDCIWQLIETMFLFFFKVKILVIQIFIVFYYEVQQFKIYFISIMMLSVSALLLVMKLLNKLKHPNNTSSTLIIQFLKTICCIQIMLITLKWEQQLPWSWLQVFLLLWVFLVVNCLLLFISFVSCVETAIKIFKKQQSYHTLAGNIWILIMFLGFTIFPFLFLIQVTQYYDSKLPLTFDEAANSITIQGLFSLFIVIYTLCFYKQIKTYLRDAQGISIQEENSPTVKKIDFQKLSMPLYLIKLSCTYFAVLDKAAFEFKQKQINVPMSPKTVQSVSVRENVKQQSNSLIEQRKAEVIEVIEPQKPATEASFSQEKCLVCYENQPNIVLIPCRHGGLCHSCVEDMIQKSNECYLCRQPIQQVLKVTRDKKKQLQVQEASIIS